MPTDAAYCTHPEKRAIWQHRLASDCQMRGGAVAVWRRCSGNCGGLGQFILWSGKLDLKAGIVAKARELSNTQLSGNCF